MMCWCQNTDQPHEQCLPCCDAAGSADLGLLPAAGEIQYLELIEKVAASRLEVGKTVSTSDTARMVSDQSSRAFSAGP